MNTFFVQVQIYRRWVHTHSVWPRGAMQPPCYVATKREPWLRLERGTWYDLAVIDTDFSCSHVLWWVTRSNDTWTSAAKVQFSPVLCLCRPNPELDPWSSSEDLAELRTGPWFRVHNGPVLVQGGCEPWTGCELGNLGPVPVQEAKLNSLCLHNHTKFAESPIVYHKKHTVMLLG